MGRPREHGPRIATGLRLSPELHQRLTDAAADRDVPAQRIIVKAIEHYLDRLVPLDDLLRTHDD